MSRGIVRGACCVAMVVSLVALAQAPAPTTSQMRVGIFTKLQYDLDYFSGVLKTKAQGKRDSRLSNADWDREVRRAANNVPVLKRLFSERADYDGRGKLLSLPPRDDVHKVYANLIALLNMLSAYDRGDFTRVLQMGERVTVTSNTDLGLVRSDDAKYYLNLYREYFWFMAAAHYRLGNDREAIAWLSRIDSDANVAELKKELSKIDTRSAADRLSKLYEKSVAILPPVDQAPGADTGWMAAGFAEVFTTDLQRYTSLTVMERANVDKVVREIQLSQAGITEPKNAIKLAGQLAAGSFIRGTYKQQGETVSLALELVDGDTGAVLAKAAGTAASASLFVGGREVLLALVRDAGWMSADVANELRAARAPAVDTIKGLLQARLLLASKSEQAKKLYEQAMKDSPEYARAFADVKDQFKGVNPLVAVMNFVNITGREEDQWMAYGAAEGLNTDLPTIGFTLVERTQLAKVMKEQLFGQVVDEKNAGALAQKLGADFVLLGSVMVAGREARADCRFVDVGTGVVVQTFTASGPPDEFPLVMAKLAAEIARRFNVKLTDAQLKNLSGNRLSKAEFERMAREKLLADRLVSQKAEEEVKEEARAKSRAPALLAGGGVLVGAGVATASLLMASRAAGDVAYVEGLQQFASRPEDIANLEASHAQGSAVQTAWTAVGVGGLVLSVGSAAVLAWKLLSEEPAPAAKSVGVVTLTPSVTATPTQVGVGLLGSF